MRRSPLGNALAAVMLLWFAIVMAEPALLHSCPVHSGMPSAHAASETGNPGDRDAATEDHAHHAAPAGSAAHESPSHHGDDPDQHRCACIGDCSTGTSITALPVVDVPTATSLQWNVRAGIVRDASPIVTAPEFLRPYANGPPSGPRIA